MRKGSKASSEMRRKISDSMKGRVAWNKGVPMSEGQKRKISATKKGKVQTDEQKEKNRQGQYRRYLKLNPNYELVGRNLRIAKNGGFYSNGEWETLKAQYNWTCPSCGRKEPEINLTRDHIVPLLRGGSNNIENIQPLCRNCNCRKHTDIVRYENYQK